ncbi:MAG: hypothetical protein N2445_09515, partial [Acidobacteria bacterium]|nr:hypothetical protein [Acidobacteriota bacterium]
MMQWASEPTADGYRVYRGTKAQLINLCDSNQDFCRKFEGPINQLDVTSDDPVLIDGANRVVYYLITGYNAGGEGPAGA